MLDEVCGGLAPPDDPRHLRAVGRRRCARGELEGHAHCVDLHRLELTHSLRYSLTHSLTHSLSHHLTQAVVQGVTHSITHSLVHYYYCIYCYKSGDFCRYCYYYNDWLRLSKQTGAGHRFGRVEERVY